MQTPKCIHCGALLTNGLHLNPWLQWPSYECPYIAGAVPRCHEGQQWYADNTVKTVGGRMHKSEMETT